MRTLPTIALVATLLSASLDAATLKVPRDYPTIQAAVTASTHGDTIKISRGTYSENVVIDARFGLTLKGKSGVTINPGGTGVGITATNCLGLVIQNITITNTGAQGIYLHTGVIDIEIRNCTIKNTGGSGVYSLHIDRTKIVGCSFRNTGSDAIYVNFCDNSLVDGNTIKNSGASAIRYVGDRSTIRDNRVIGGTVGISLAASDLNVVHDNSIKGCTSDGITINASSDDNSVFDNSVKGAGDDGMSSNTTSGRTRFYKNTIKSPSGNGFEISGPACELSANTIKKAVGHGVFIDAIGDETFLEGNRIKKSTGNGILIDTDDNLFIGNTISSSGILDINEDTGVTGNAYIANTYSTSNL